MLQEFLYSCYTNIGATANVLRLQVIDGKPCWTTNCLGRNGFNKTEKILYSVSDKQYLPLSLVNCWQTGISFLSQARRIKAAPVRLVQSAVLPQLKPPAWDTRGDLPLVGCTARFPCFHGACGGGLLQMKLLFAGNAFLTVPLCLKPSLT